jgi:glypican 1
MVLITDKFWGPSGAESVIGSVHMWLAEAINALLDNKDTLTAKVWAEGMVSTGGGIPDMAPPGSEEPCCSSRTPVLSLQVIQGCGNPKVNPQGTGSEEKRRRGKLALQEKPPTGTLEKLVSDPQPFLWPCHTYVWGGQERQAVWSQAAQWPD